MHYDQKIRYLEMQERGEKLKGAGFVKLECWGKTCNLLIQLSCMERMADGEREWFLEADGMRRPIGKMEVVDGRGRLELRDLDCENIAGSGLGVHALDRACMPLTKSKEVVGVLGEQDVGRKESARDDDTRDAGREESVRDAGRRTLIKDDGRREEPPSQTEGVGAILEGKGTKGPEENKTAGKGPEENKGAGEGNEKDESAEKGPEENKGAGKGPKKDGTTLNGIGKNETTGKDTEENEPEGKCFKEIGPTEKGIGKNEAMGKSAEGKAKQLMAADQSWEEQPVQGLESDTAEGKPGEKFRLDLKEGKWEQLRAIYPKVAPFGDKRRYLQITPGDFVILKEKSYRMVNNSFLLHGYFTYKHLILHKEERRGETVYFVGVPGQFYDQEKEVAILFGFESFEGRTEPAKEGDFGYYMMRVEL